MSVRDMEATHDYIQWLFPLMEPSSVSMHAPVLDGACISALVGDPRFRTRLLRAFDKMLGFYGLKMVAVGETVRVSKAAFFERQAHVWLSPDNHNFMRLTRIMRSLSLLSERPLARSLLVCLQTIAAEQPDIVGATTLAHWLQAVSNNSDEA